MKKYILFVLIAALASLSSGCAGVTLYRYTGTDMARESAPPRTETDQQLDLAECERTIEKNAHALGGANFVVAERERKDLMNWCMMRRGHQLAELQ